MLKKIGLASLLLITLSAQAELAANSQTESYTGTAGDKSSQVSVDSFLFDKFDESLGTLTGVLVNYNFLIDNGYIGADNLTNVAVVGSGELGGSLFFSSGTAFINNSFASLFTPLSLSETTVFNLAADPLQTNGGNGPDVQQFNGSSLSLSSGILEVSPFVWNQFNGSGGKITVDFTTNSTVIVDAANSQGFFKAVDVTLDFTLTYLYELPEVTTDVSAPFALGLLSFGGFAFASRKRKSK